jgi:hypothetical protein
MPKTDTADRKVYFVDLHGLTPYSLYILSIAFKTFAGVIGKSSTHTPIAL